MYPLVPIGSNWIRGLSSSKTHPITSGLYFLMPSCRFEIASSKFYSSNGSPWNIMYLHFGNSITSKPDGITTL